MPIIAPASTPQEQAPQTLPAGPLTPAPVTLGDLSIGVRDSNGVEFLYESIKGWHGGSGVRSSSSPRPRAHGHFDGPTYRDALVVTLSGSVWAPTRDLAADAVRRLTAVAGSGDLVTLTVNDPDLGSLSSEVRLAAEPQIDWSREQFAEWQLSLASADPRKYGPEVTVSTGLPSPGGGLSYPLTYPLDYGDVGDLGTVQLENVGTADAWPVFTVFGPLPAGFEVSSSGRRIVYAAEVPAGGTVLLDSSDGSVLREGTADRRGDVTVAEWFPVPAGGSITVQFTSLGGYDPNAQLSASVRPAYW